MKDVKYHLYLSYQEQSQLLKALVNLKNELLAQGKYAEPVDELIIKVTKARRKKLKVIRQTVTGYPWVTSKSLMYTYSLGPTM